MPATPTVTSDVDHQDCGTRTVNGVRLHHEERGSGTAILRIHGASSSALRGALIPTAGVGVILPLLALSAGAALSVTAADARAARYVAEPDGGGRVVLNVSDGRLRRARAALHAPCESNNGRRFQERLAIDLRGSLALRSGRFRIQGRAPSNVRYDLRGRLRDGTISGRTRLTFLDLDYVGPSDDSYLCDTGTRRFRAQRSGAGAVALAVFAGTAPAAGPPKTAAHPDPQEQLAGQVARLTEEVRVLQRRLARVERTLRRGVETRGSVRRLRSADGRFSINLSNSRIRLRAPGASILLGPSSLELATGTTTLELSPATAALRSTSGAFGVTGTAALTAPLLTLGGASGCPPVARRGDPVRVPFTGELATGSITTGSAGVLAC